MPEGLTVTGVRERRFVTAAVTDRREVPRPFASLGVLYAERVTVELERDSANGRGWQVTGLVVAGPGRETADGGTRAVTNAGTWDFTPDEDTECGVFPDFAHEYGLPDWALGFARHVHADASREGV